MRGLAEAELLEANARHERRLRWTKPRTRQVRAELRRVREEQAELVAQVAAKDLQLAAELAAYRQAVTKLAESPDPRERAALERYAHGERRQAVAVLEVLAAAKRKTRQQVTDISSVAELREITPLYRDMKDRGEMTAAEVAATYEAIVVLDPGVVWDWIYLVHLYEEAGQLDKAAHAADSAAKLARTDAANHRDSDQHSRDLLVVLGVLGEVSVAAGDLAAARKYFEESLEIARALSRSNPSSALAKRDVSVILVKLGSATNDARYFQEALAILRVLDAEKRLAPRDKQFLQALEKFLSKKL